MAWESSGTNLQQLVTNLQRHHIIKSDTVAHAMKSVDRAKYCVDPRGAYQDRPQSIGYNATISAPHMHAYAMEYMMPNLREGAKVLDIGSGSGYLTACFAQIVGRSGRVVGIEHVKELVDLSLKNIRKDNPDLLDIVTIKVGDGRLGYQDEAPYDCIHVGA